MIRLFESTDHAEKYKKFRLRSPPFVVQKVVNFLEEELPRPHGLAVDVGCGSGQNTACWAPYFTSVAGFDVSPAQIDAARQEVALPSNVTFAVAPAEMLPVADCSVELVVGSFSFHWFDFETFFREVDRVLVPNGVVAAIAHEIHRVAKHDRSVQLNQLMDTFVSNYLTAEMHERNRHAFNGYRELPLPYSYQVRCSGMPLERETTVAFLVGAYASWSSYQKLHSENPQVMEAALQRFQEEFLKIMDVTTAPEDTPLTLKYDYCVAMCRKPA